MALIGYARVSTQSQDLTEQIEALEKFGCTKIFAGKHSGKAKDNEEQLSKMLDYVREGDVVVVTKFDRLGRSLNQCLNILEEFKKQEIGFIALDQNIDTTKKTDPLSVAMIHLLGLFAELERSFIVERTQGGKQAKIAAGDLRAKGGRPVKINAGMKEKIAKDFNNGLSLSETARKHKISIASVKNVKKELKEKKDNLHRSYAIELEKFCNSKEEIEDVLNNTQQHYNKCDENSDAEYMCLLVDILENLHGKNVILL
ncbi:recombinase family protein [Ursidibacter arcticus]